MDSDKLTIITPIRFSPNQRRALSAYAQAARMSEGEAVRLAVMRFLRGKAGRIVQPAPRATTSEGNHDQALAT